MKMKINFNIFIYIFFLTFFSVGIFIFSDYAVTPDEPLHRENGLISLKYIFSLFFTDLTSNELVVDIPNLYNDWRKTYGTLFDLPFAFIEFFFELNIEKIFLLKHFSLFIIYFISTIFFFS